MTRIHVSRRSFSKLGVGVLSALAQPLLGGRPASAQAAYPCWVASYGFNPGDEPCGVRYGNPSTFYSTITAFSPNGHWYLIAVCQCNSGCGSPRKARADACNSGFCYQSCVLYEGPWQPDSDEAISA